jgi:hypothetical protein
LYYRGNLHVYQKGRCLFCGGYEAFDDPESLRQPLGRGEIEIYVAPFFFQ